MTQRYSALLAALFASLMLSQAPAHADSLEDVVKRGVLKVAVPQDFAPFGSVGPDMQPRGLDIVTAKGDGALEKNALTWLKEPLPADL